MIHEEISQGIVLYVNDFINFKISKRNTGVNQSFIGQITQIEYDNNMIYGYYVNIITTFDTVYRYNYYININDNEHTIRFRLYRNYIDTFKNTLNHDKFRQLLASYMGSLVFRKVLRTNHRGLWGIGIYNLIDNNKFLSWNHNDNFIELTRKYNKHIDNDKQIVKKWFTHFGGTTEKTQLFNNDKLDNVHVGFDRHFYSTYGFTIGGISIRHRLYCHSPPKDGNIICGNIYFNKERNHYYYKDWFICSPQFITLWRLVQYGIVLPFNDIKALLTPCSELICSANGYEGDCTSDIYQNIATIIYNEKLPDPKGICKNMVDDVYYKITGEFLK